MDEAYEQGWSDAERGKAMHDNPYPRGSGEEIIWRWGYRAFYTSVGLAVTI